MALKVREYDLRQIYRGKKISYSAGLGVRTAVGAGTGPFSSLKSSSTKTVRLQRIRVSGFVATAALYSEIALKKTSALATSGTSVAMTAVPYVTGSAAATAAPLYWTTLPTAGTPIGTIMATTIYLPLVGTTTQNPGEIIFDFTQDGELETPTLTTTGLESFELNFGTTTTNAPSLLISWSWTEE